MYCPKCKQIVDAAKCPNCKKPTREVTDSDICLLCEKQRPFAEMLHDVLEQNGIESLLMSSLGAGLDAYLGANTEYCKLYTLYSDRSQAQELETALFSPDAICEEEEQ